MYAVIPCPTCGRRNDAHTNTEGGADPEPGDVTLCWGCSQPAIFTRGLLGDLTLRVATPEEEVAILTDPAVLAAIAAMAGHRTPEDAIAFLQGRTDG